MTHADLMKRTGWNCLFFILCFLGIFINYLINGVLVQDITRLNGFRYYLSILFLPVLFNCMLAKVMIFITKWNRKRFTLNFESSEVSVNKVNLKQGKSFRLCLLCSIFYVVAMFFANAALKYLTYPMQIIGKSAKPISVMIFGMLGAGQRYSPQKYVSVLMVVAGISTFMYSHSIKKTEKSSTKSSYFGIWLLLLSLFCDGAVAACQEWLRSLGSIESNELMFTINKWAGLLIGTGTILSGELYDFLEFCTSTNVFPKLVLLGITSALGQKFIFLTIVFYGPLVCSLITTCRKFFAIVLSIAIFGDNLSGDQWLTVSVVFCGLFLEAFYPN